MTIIEQLFSKVPFVLLGGVIWQLYLHWRGRTFEKRLLIDITSSTKPFDEKRILFVEVQLTNAGRGKLEARRVGPTDYVYHDEDEQLRYSCSLQIKRINGGKIANETLLDWYNCTELEAVPNVPREINLLDDYVVPAEDNKIIFWMEPEDVVHLSASLVLLPGSYLLKVSFYGANPNEDFWSRLVFASV